MNGIDTALASLLATRIDSLLNIGPGSAATTQTGAADVEECWVICDASDGDASGVVSAVFKAAQAFHDEGYDVFGADVTNDSAHS